MLDLRIKLLWGVEKEENIKTKTGNEGNRASWINLPKWYSNVSWIGISPAYIGSMYLTDQNWYKDKHEEQTNSMQTANEGSVCTYVANNYIENN